MNSITHSINMDGNLIIDATWDNNTYGAVIVPRVINGIVYIKSSSINTLGCDNPLDMKERIISFVTTQKGKKNEAPIIVEDDEKSNIAL